MGANLPNPQGLVISNSLAPQYDDNAKTLSRFTEISAVQITTAGKTPILGIGQMVDGVGLMFGLNLKGSGHVLRKNSNNKEVLKFAFGAGGAWPTTLQEIAEDNAVKAFLDDAFDMQGRWVGFSIPVGGGYQGDSLYIQTDVRQFKLKHRKSAHFVPIIAALGQPSGGNIFKQHFVSGLSVFSAGRGSGSEDFASEIIAFP